MILLISTTVAFFGLSGGDLLIPPGLKLGATTSAVQIEGAWNVDGKSPSVVDHGKGNVSSDDACKSYELWRTDLQLIKDLGLQIYRFSIPWTRILPTGRADYINQAAVDHYNQLIDALLEIGVEPMVTMLHFDLPQSLQELGGFQNPDFPDWLAEYARVLFSLYGDRVKTWLTVNEPIEQCFFSTKTFGDSYFHLCSKIMLLGHAKAWRVYDSEFRDKQKGQVSIAININWILADNEDDVLLAEHLRQYYGGVYSHPIFSKEGGWPRDLQKALSEKNISLPELTRQEIELMKGTHDFYCLNYYFTAHIVHKARVNEAVGPWSFAWMLESKTVLEIPSSFKRTHTSDRVHQIHSEGIRATMNWLNRQYGVKRFMIGENGVKDDGILEDYQRILYIQDHLQQVILAIIEDSLEVFGYAVWSLLDNYEFMNGYKHKYGLYSVDFTHPMRTRTPRASAYYYKNLIENAKNGRATKLFTGHK